MQKDTNNIFELTNFSVNTLTANYECSRSNSENLPLPIQMQKKLIEKLKTFSQIFIAFLELALNFKGFFFFK